MKYLLDKRHMLPPQRAWWELPNFIRLLVGGYGSGKTHIGALRAIALSYLNAGLPGQYVSPSYPMAKKTIIPTLTDIFERAGLDVTQHQTDHTFHIRNWDGHIWIGSGESPDSLKGPNLAWAGIDEPFIQPRAVFNQMLARVRHPQARQREIFLTGTPEELNWGYELATNDEGRYDVGVVLARTADNIHLPPDYITTLRSAFSEDLQAAYLEGRFVNLTTGRVYTPFDRSRHLTHLDVTGLVPACGVDFNVDYLTAELFVSGPNWLHFFDEIRLSNATTFELADILQAHYPGIAIYPDPSGQARHTSATGSDHEILRQAGFTIRAHPAQPPVRARVNAVNRMLKDGRMTIEPGRCPQLLQDFERCRWTPDQIDKSDPARTHAADAAGYATEYLFPIARRQVSYDPAPIW